MPIQKSHKIQGWISILIHFWFQIRVIFGGLLLYSTMPALQGESMALKIVWVLTWIVFAATAGTALAAAYKLKNVREPSSVRFALLAIWISGPIAQILMAVAAIMPAVVLLPANTADGAVDALIGHAVGKAIIATVFATLWTLYLKRSQEIRAIYFGEGVPAEIATPKFTKDFVNAEAPKTEWDEMV